ncbi:helix-turn-helix domain-containing protein [Sporosarcina sp. G11-34]|uniref:helix-turn-helix domain-containing protein n=1 Tax=Sporosarcina sp. G11-34 TaxID=2849605 RepID=UPI0022A961E6|nr:helix-turn-helix transcriptional regulator [Sporosarcina sp. G11-34]MCZ2256961.1 helix-turn-helix domain-containing protein [Sporosarcina sp. G11-34]
MDWNPEKFGNRLRALRERVGFTMMAFGKEIGTSASRIKNWEEGKSVPSASWIVEISNRFDVSVEELLKGNIDKTYPLVSEDSISTLFDQIAEEKPYYNVGHREEIEELVKRISSLKDRKYAGPDGREQVVSEITTHLDQLKDQDLLEIRTLIQLKVNHKSGGSRYSLT